VNDYLLVFAVALATVMVATPVIGKITMALGLAVDRPDERRIHKIPTPRLGGLALFAGVLAGLAVASRLPSFEPMFTTSSEPLAVVLAGLVIMGVGLVDDVRGVSASVKLAGQILAAGTLVLFGIVLLFVYIPGNPGSLIALDRDLAALITILAIVAMINAVNLVDGLDGLATGIVAIAATALLIYVQSSDAQRAPVRPLPDGAAAGAGSASALILVILIAVCVGFLVYNFHPASIFMGDSGAMLLGLLLGAGGVSAIGNVVLPTRADFAALSVPVLIPVLVLAVPFLDTIWTILRRLRTGRAVFSPDKKHLHHRLVGMGHSHRRAVLTMYYWSALVAFAAVGVGLLPLRQVVGIFGIGLALAVVALAVPSLVRRLGGERRRAEGRRGRAKGRVGRRARGAEPRRHFVFPFTKSRAGAAKTRSDQRKRVERNL
jgi:UDP-GlcNAc:undecaprenyl-phosphate/decaprenyl-phosphate GlcNAc-1-phosphate transferase